MIAVLDTNVIISALLITGSTTWLVVDALWEGVFEAVISEALLAELARVLSRPRIRRRLRWGATDETALFTRLRTTTTAIEPRKPLSVLDRDPADNRVLEAAVEGNAEFIVTGDQDLLALGGYAGIEIVTPRRFLSIIEERSGH